MVERSTKAMHNDQMVDGVDVPVLDSSEKWSEFTLEDGVVVRAKNSLLSAIRLVGVYDENGSPVYQLSFAGAIGFASVPDNLKKPK